MKKEKKVWAITLIAFWWLAPNLIQAQQDSIRSGNLDSVVITATKFPKNVVETAKVLTIIDEEQIARSSGKDLAQLLNEQTGLVVTGANSNPGSVKGVFLRGATGAYTLITIDGVPLNDPSGVGGVFDLRALQLDQVERIEILKGSQSTLYGTDAIAGVINIITKKKGKDPINLFLSDSYGSYNTLRSNIGIGGNTKVVSYNVGWTWYKSDGINEKVDPGGDLDGFDQTALQANIGIAVTKNLNLRPFVRYNRFDGAFDQDDSFSGVPNDAVPDSYTTTFFNPGITGDLKLKKGTLNLLSSYSRTDRTFRSDFSSSYKGRFLHWELFWLHNFTDQFQFIFGWAEQNLQMLDAAAGGQDPTIRINSPYLSFFVKNFRNFSLEIGGRFNNHTKFGNSATYTFNPAYLINNRVKIFANVSSGFKTPTLTQLSGSFGANPDLAPERSQSLEGGIQYFGNDHKFDVRVTGFQRKVNDVITFVSDPVTFAGQYVNVNEQNDWGVETEATFHPSSALTLKAFYAFVDGFLIDKTGTTEAKTYGLIRRPKNSFGLNAGYRFTPAFSVSLNVKTFGKRSDTDFATFTSVTLESYTLLDLYAEYKLLRDKLNIFVDAKNLLNQDYMEIYGYNTLKTNVMAGFTFRL